MSLPVRDYRARSNMLTRLYAALTGRADFLSIVFPGSDEVRIDAYRPSAASADELCAKLRAYYDQRPRPWRRRCDAPKQPRLERGRVFRRGWIILKDREERSYISESLVRDLAESMRRTLKMREEYWRNMRCED